MRPRAAPRILCMLLFAAATASCAMIDDLTGRGRGEDKRIESVAASRPDPGSLRQEQHRVEVLRLPRVESVGTCAPPQPIGGSVACINNQACRGFGVREQSGRILCSCYGVVGGCAEGQRCDDKKLACVPESEPPIGRSRAN